MFWNKKNKHNYLRFTYPMHESTYFIVIVVWGALRGRQMKNMKSVWKFPSLRKFQSHYYYCIFN